MDSPKTRILYISFNQNSTCLALGTEKGYRIYDLQTPNHDFYERCMDGGIGLIEMLYRSNILVLAGGGINPKFPQNKLILWDDCNEKKIAELSFNCLVINAKIRKDKLFVVTSQKIFIFNNQSFQLIDALIYENFENKKGIIAITYEPKINIIAYPDVKKGYIKTKNYDTDAIQTINAQDTDISFLCFGLKGKIIATSAVNDSNLRIYTSNTGCFLHQFKFNTISKEILSISFDSENKFLMASNDNGVIFVFSLKEINEIVNSYEVQDEKNKTEQSASKMINSSFNNFFKADEKPWSYLNISEKKSISTFTNGSYGKNRIVAVTPDGNFYMARFDENKPGISFKEEDISLFQYSID